MHLAIFIWMIRMMHDEACALREMYDFDVMQSGSVGFGVTDQERQRE